MTIVAPELGKHSWPVTAAHSGIGARLTDLLGDALIAVDEHCGDVAVTVQRDRLVEVVLKLRDAEDLKLNQLIDICGADYPERAERFEIVTHLLSMAHNLRLRIRLSTDGAAPVPSLTDVYPNAGWYERETWDCYGVMFTGNPDMRRILTDYGFEGHPFRKDFPLTGHVELRWSEEHKRVVYEPVKLAQDFRSFDFLSPWDGTDYVLPGDEKAQAK
ncbi:MAG: NADH-quinone oxidoreductase subunit C [Sphingomonadales bacterium]|jgi:NADH-quinone oxidoreductase subunit C